MQMNEIDMGAIWPPFFFFIIIRGEEKCILVYLDETISIE